VLPVDPADVGSLRRWIRALTLTASALSLSACRCGLFETYVSPKNEVIPTSVSHQEFQSFSPGPNGELSFQDCQQHCYHTVRGCKAGVATTESATVLCEYSTSGHCVDRGCMFGCGRTPEGLEDQPLPEGLSPAARYFARMTQLEAVSVPAFESLAQQLKRFHAPKNLIRRAQLAAKDEARHATLAEAQAKRFGSEFIPLGVLPERTTDLVTFAIHNAREGCVRETFAALLAALQARQAIDPAIQTLFFLIARDEARHGALAWSIHRWVCAQLSEHARANVHNALVAAAEELPEHSLGPSELETLAGLPNDEQIAYARLAFIQMILAAESMDS
jgi:hypothetical protein